MTREEIIKTLESCGYRKDSAATKMNHYSVTKSKSLTKKQVENRNSTGWGKGEYIIAEYSNEGADLDKVLEGWKRLTAKYKNQYLILEVEKDSWRVYDSHCQELGGEHYIESTFAGKSIQTEPHQKIFLGCPGTGKSFRVNQIVEDNAEKRIIRFAHYLKAQTLGSSSIEKYLAVPQIGWVVDIARDHVKGEDISTIYDICDPVKVARINEQVSKTDKDTNGGAMYSVALGHYSKMLEIDTVFRTTFHPDSDYASFVGCYKPRMNKGSIEYSFCPQVFTDAYITAWKHPYTTIYLVIEEINRGNCAQIFGDLFQLLDRKNGYSEYPIKADNDLADYIEQELGKGNPGIIKRELCLPPNLFIFATMNTSDQSLFPMDSAFQRRWEREYIRIESGCPNSQFEIEVNGRKYSWADFLTKVNKRITELTDSEDKMLGNFFIKDNISEKDFKSKVMFYLWNEICKDYVHSDTFFKALITKNGKEGLEEFTFSQLYEEGSSLLLEGFMKALKVAEVTEDTEDEQESDDSTDNTDDQTSSIN